METGFHVSEIQLQKHIHGCKLQASDYRLRVDLTLIQKMKDFKKLHIWQLGMDIIDKVYDIAQALPQEERFGLRSQMTRSAVSIPSNIAEGSAKRSVKEQIKFYEISLGSAFELETHTLSVQRRNWIDERKVKDLLEMITREQKMIVKFIEKIEGSDDCL